MRNRVVLALAVLAAVAALVGCGGGNTPTGGKVLTGKKLVLDGATKVGDFGSGGATVSIEVYPAMSVALRWRRGAYAEFQTELTNLKTWATTNGVELGADVPPFVFYYDYDANKTVGRYVVGAQVPPGTGTFGDAGIHIDAFTEPWSVGVREHDGPYDGIWPVIEDVTKWLNTNYAGEVGVATHFLVTEPPTAPRSKVGRLLGPLPFPPPDTL